ncbi:TOBE domain-containing protein [Pseudodesulfovibrio sp.]|uniref:TOBE domain-containing protein n=1 Tax=Pseudodesulfovibrio sp. TaxID=2035812 RepID=UPI0026056055|nr:TOBE domain-containing protein [Pseudodesulfovibrio sp.]MDD3312212.1 TOBE domain-containing protein [Pseudodesulfovibrio sp.]
MAGTGTGGEIYLDSVQMQTLERAFREWAEASPRQDVRLSRRRILLLFLLIRYTGAKLNETLSLDLRRDIDTAGCRVHLRGGDEDGASRDIQLSESLAGELRRAMSDPDFMDSIDHSFDVDPAFVRRKFYERAEACGFDKRLGSPEMLRKARAVELMQGNLPLPAVQLMLGQSVVSQAASSGSFSESDLREVTRLYMDRESDRRTSARNAFYGKVTAIARGDIQARVELATADGHAVATLITLNSLERLCLTPGKLVTAEVKAPYVMLERGGTASSSADNVFEGAVVRIASGKISTEYIVRISEAAELCSVVSTASANRLDLRVGDPVRALFNGYSVVLHA